MGVDALADILFFKGIIMGVVMGCFLGIFLETLIVGLYFVLKRKKVNKNNDLDEQCWGIEKERTNHV